MVPNAPAMSPQTATAHRPSQAELSIQATLFSSAAVPAVMLLMFLLVGARHGDHHHWHTSVARVDAVNALYVAVARCSKQLHQVRLHALALSRVCERQRHVLIASVTSQAHLVYHSFSPHFETTDVFRGNPVPVEGERLKRNKGVDFGV